MALGVEAIGLYQYHRPDPSSPYAESVGTLADLLDAGNILMAGMSNATVAQIDEARRYSAAVWSASRPVLAPVPLLRGGVGHCERLGVAFIPWSPLGGIRGADRIAVEFPPSPKWPGTGVTPEQVTLAWMLAKGSRVVPIPASSRPATAIAAAAAADLLLAGTRWPASTPPDRGTEGPDPVFDERLSPSRDGVSNACCDR